MRLFIAVELDEEVRAVAAGVARDLRERLPGVAARWVDADKMHLTVRFIGHVEDAQAPAILEAIAAPVALAPFDVELGSCGVFPRSGPPRVVWIGLKQGLDSLQTLHQEFNRRLAPLGFVAEDRPFSAHLTLARVKDAPRGLTRTARATVAATRVPPAACRIDAATVFQSALSPKGSSYTRLLTAELRTANR
jgi:2'-5' RNA ligase